MYEDLISNLTGNGFDAQVAGTADEAKSLIMGMIPSGVAVGVGGSMTVRELGLLTALRERGHEVLDHWQEGLSPEEARRVKLGQLTAPVFLTSVNALTKDGVLVNVDNTGNRVAAMIFGPGQVIAVVGRNKIVADVPTALERIKTCVAPLNAMRRKDKTPCAKTGTCEDCRSPGRLCRVTTILERKTRGMEKFTVIIVDQELGY